MSNSSRPSGAAYAPRLRTCASPQIWFTIPVCGSSARSAAITGAAPRKNPNGEASIRSYFSPTSPGTRPRIDSSISRSGSCVRSFASQCA